MCFRSFGYSEGDCYSCRLLCRPSGEAPALLAKQPLFWRSRLPSSSTFVFEFPREANELIRAAALIVGHLGWVALRN